LDSNEGIGIAFSDIQEIYSWCNAARISDDGTDWQWLAVHGSGCSVPNNDHILTAMAINLVIG